MYGVRVNFSGYNIGLPNLFLSRFIIIVHQILNMERDKIYSHVNWILPESLNQ
jgi:hypothetical protein